MTVVRLSQECEYRNGDGIRGKTAKKWVVIKTEKPKVAVCQERGGFVDDRREIEVAGDLELIEFSPSESML
jgi:hypothetical protein